jgi:hypothetical protein
VPHPDSNSANLLSTALPKTTRKPTAKIKSSKVRHRATSGLQFREPAFYGIAQNHT